MNIIFDFCVSLLFMQAHHFCSKTKGVPVNILRHPPFFTFRLLCLIVNTRNCKFSVPQAKYKIAASAFSRKDKAGHAGRQRSFIRLSDRIHPFLSKDFFFSQSDHLFPALNRYASISKSDI